MATANPPPPGGTKVEEFIEEPIEGGLSLAELDAMIAKEDPDFTGQLAEIHSDDAKSELNIEMLDLDDMLKQSEGKTFKARWSRAKLYLRSKGALIWVHSRNTISGVAVKSFEVSKNGLSRLQDQLRLFKFMPVKKKLAIFGALVLIGGTGFFIYRAVTKGWLAAEPPLFVRTLEEWSTQKQVFDAAEKKESFYDSSRAAQNLFSLKRIVVNIRRSDGSGPNPMAAFEFYLEGNSTEAIVEVKDRESEISDRFQRTMEEMSYDQLASVEGKQLLLEKLRRDINKVLSLGQIRKIYIKGVVVKP